MEGMSGASHDQGAKYSQIQAKIRDSPYLRLWKPMVRWKVNSDEKEVKKQRLLFF